MYKKAKIDRGIVFIDEKEVGAEKDFYNGTIIIEGKDGTTLFAEYGTMVDGEFYPLCRRTVRCLQCNMHDSPNCRYNRATNGNAGYYMEVPDAG